MDLMLVFNIRVHVSYYFFDILLLVPFIFRDENFIQFPQIPGIGSHQQC